MNSEKETRDRVNAMYREEGWGKVVEHFGHEPYDVESQARSAYAEIYECLDDPFKMQKLREATGTLRPRQVLVSSTLIDADKVNDLRADIITLRDECLRAGRMDWAVVLSHNIALLACLNVVLSGDRYVNEDGDRLYMEIKPDV